MDKLDKKNLNLVTTLLYGIHSYDSNKEMRQHFINSISLLIPCNNAAFFLSNHKSGENLKFTNPVSYNIPIELLNDYVAKEQINDYSNWIFQIYNTSSSVYRSSDLFDQNIREKSQWYKKSNKSLDLYYELQMSITIYNTFLGVVALYRGKTDHDFTDNDIYLLNLLKTHLALRLYYDYTISNEEHTVTIPNKIIQKYALTKREVEIIYLILDGKSDEEMAAISIISITTIRKHIANIYRKLKIKRRHELFTLLLESEKLVL